MSIKLRGTLLYLVLIPLLIQVLPIYHMLGEFGRPPLGSKQLPPVDPIHQSRWPSGDTEFSVSPIKSPDRLAWAWWWGPYR